MSGGFGSAGSSRSLRRTASAVGIGQTAQSYQAEKHVPDARLDDPKATELRQALRDGRCWWCDREGFKSILAHISRGHNIDRFQVRRLAQLTKYGVDSKVASPEYREECRQRALARGIKLVPPGKGAKRQLSMAAVRMNQEKLKKAWAMPNAAEIRLAGSKKAGAISRAKAKGHPCPVCGAHVHLARHRTCRSAACIFSRKSSNGLLQAHYLTDGR